MRYVEELISRQVNRWNSITQALHYAPGQGPEGEAKEAAPVPPAFPTICISREMGSGAREIASGLCERLGYEFFGSSIIDEIAKDLNVQRQLVDSLDEWGRSELEFMLETYLRGREFESQEYVKSLVRVVKTLAMKGAVVLLGRGATFILKDEAALNVLVISPLETRIKRLMDYDHLDEKTARERVVKYDHQRESFIKHYFGQDIHNPHNFDLTINTGRIPPAEASKLILQALELRGYELDKITIDPALR